MANDGRIGVEESGAQSAIQNLELAKTALLNWRDEMMNLKSQVVAETLLAFSMRATQDLMPICQQWKML